MANSGGGQFSEDAQFPDRFAQPGPGRKRPMPQFGGDADFDPGFQKRGRFDGPEEEPSVPPATLRILVRQHDAGGIIGKGGENIKRLRKLHDCQVVLPDSPGAPERVMTIMGRVEGCIGVLKDTLPKLGDGCVWSLQPVTEKGGNELAYEVQVLIPQPFMGTIIGTGGTKIKELRSKTRTSIKIFSEPMPNSNERSVQLIGTEVQIVECIEYFLDEISKKEPREPIFLYEPTAEGDMFPGPGGPPPGGDFPPHRGGHNFRGGRDGGRQGFRGGGRGRNGSDRGRGRGGGGSFQRSWKSDQDRGPGGGAPPPPFQPPPPPNPAPPVMGGSGYNPPSHLPAANTSYGQANVGYSSMPPSSLPPPTSGTSSMGQGGVPPMYMPPAAPAAPSVPLPSIPPPGQQTQQVTIPNEYAMSILGVNGGNLEHIKNQSSCEIVINDPKPGSTERIINITGNPASIQLAQTLMQNSVRQYHSV